MCSLGCPKRRSVVIVGIAGASGSGKSTLANSLAKTFYSVCTAISSDWYFDRSRMPLDKNGSRNWEHPEGVDFEKLLVQLKSLKFSLETCEIVPDLQVETTRGWRQLLAPHLKGGEKLGKGPIIIFVEGFLLFTDAKVAKLCDERIWLDIDCETALHRRYTREAQRWKAEPTQFAEWFKTTVWSNYQIYKPLQLANASPLTIEVIGARGLEDVADEVSASLKVILLDSHQFDGDPIVQGV